MARHFSLFLALISCTAGLARAAPTLMRYPTASATAIAFAAHGDLWTASPAGGQARRLVHSGGYILAPRFSPDGRWLAYTERVGGSQDVYAVAAQGGRPQRLTWDAPGRAEDNLVVSWTPDSARVVFLSHRASWAYKQLRAFSVPRGGGLPQVLPLDQSGRLDFSPDGRSISFTRTFTDLDSRKRYTGGQAEDIFTYSFSDQRLTRITGWQGTDTAPMWSGRRIYFLSDRGAGWRANIWCHDLDTHEVRQITFFTDYDVDWPSLGAGRILFQQGGRLWALELPQQRLHTLDVTVPDDGARTAPRLAAVGAEARDADVSGAVDYAVSPDGKTALLAAHGDVFSLPLPAGEAQNLTATPGVDEDHPATSADGRTLAYVTEADGAQQLAVRALAGGPEHRLTRFTNAVLYTPLFSPDGRQLAVPDAQHNLWLVSVSGGPPLRVAFDPNAEVRDAAFSPDGRWLSFSTVRPSGLSALHLYDLRSGQDTVVSPALESDRLPAFAADSSALYFVSKRNERPFTTDRGDETTLSSLDSDGLYGVALGEHDLGKLMAGALKLPAASGRIVSLETRAEELIYEVRPPALIAGDLPGQTAELRALNVRTGRQSVLISDLDSHALSADGGHVLFLRHGAWHMAELGEGRDQTLNLASLRLLVDPREEWREMFEHAWQLDRDLFFSRVMNGSDWNAVHNAYARLLPVLGSRDDFLYLLGQLQGELATSHAFVFGLDTAGTAAVAHTPRLGVDLQMDPATGRYRITRIYRGDPTRERYRSPFNIPSLTPDTAPATEGDYLLAINGHELAAPMDPDSLLAGAASDVEAQLAQNPNGPRRTLRVKTVQSELDLRQHTWVEDNRERVSRLSGGRIGYMFLADFNALGSEDLMRQLQGQLDKDGLVIDIRWNRGGFTSQAVLDLLRRTRAGVFVNREGAVTPLPLFSVPRAMAVIVNAETASDGDQFAYYFQKSGLGPVIGERTWGGVQGVKGPWPLMDGIWMTVPKDSLASADGHWLIENLGVTPDIPVSGAPEEALTGQDSMLEAAVQAVESELRAHPPAPLAAPPPLPAYPAQSTVPGSSNLPSSGPPQ